MVLFSILLLILISLTVFVTLIIGVGGAAFIIVFGDVIVCACILVWILARIFRRK